LKIVSDNANKNIAAKLKQMGMKAESHALKLQLEKEEAQKIQKEELIAKEKAIKQSKIEEAEIIKQRKEQAKEIKKIIEK
jgi:hypothetical protein